MDTLGDPAPPARQPDRKFGWSDMFVAPEDDPPVRHPGRQ